MRAAALALAVLAACGGKVERQATSGGGGSGAGSSASTEYPPPALRPPTAGLAVGVAAHVVIDDVGTRLFVRKSNGLDVLALDSGRRTGRIDLGWDGEVWPAGPYVLAMRVTNQPGLEVALVDPKVLKVAARCSVAVAVPPNAMISTVDEFTTRAGTTYLQWITTPPPGRASGAHVRDDQMAAQNDQFQAAYSCGLFAIRTTGSRCTLDVASPQEAGLDGCGSRAMPWNRYLPSPIGSLTLRVDRATTRRNGLYVDTDTLVISESGNERWRLPVETRTTEPPLP